MSIFDYATDPDREKNGFKLDFGDFSFTLARAGGANRKYRNVLAEKMKPHARRIQSGDMDNAEMERLMAEAFGEAVILDWDGITDEDGTPRPCTPRVVAEFLQDPRFHDIAETIRREADRAANFRAEARDHDSGDLEKNSAGASGGAKKKRS